MNKNIYTNKAEEYIDYIIKSDFHNKQLLKKEYPGIIKHSSEDLEIAQEIYKNLKEACIKYRDGLVDAKTFSNLCSDIMYSKYSPNVVSKIIADEIYDALDYISELSFNKKR